MIPASSAASSGASSTGAGIGALDQAVRVCGAEVGAGGGLDPVGALAEVDGVQVLGEDLVLVPLLLELVGKGGLAELLAARFWIPAPRARS